MTDTDGRRGNKSVANKGGAGGLWFLGFIGALIYYLHTHSGTFWLVALAILKALVLADIPRLSPFDAKAVTALRLLGDRLRKPPDTA